MNDYKAHCMEHAGCTEKIEQLEKRADKHDATIEDIHRTTRTILTTLVAAIVMLALNLFVKGSGIVTAAAEVLK